MQRYFSSLGLLGLAVSGLASCTVGAPNPCDPPSASCRRDTGPVADAAGGEDGGNDAARADAYVPPTIYTATRVEPATAVIGCDETQAFHLIATRADGSELELFPSWSVRTPELGTVDLDGVFTPRAGCMASGVTDVSATVDDGLGGMLSASGAVTVRLGVDPVLVDVPTLADAESAFAGAAGGTASPLLYPLDGAVMPNNVLPVDIQWSGGAAGDLYRVTISNASISIVAFVANTGSGFGFHWAPPADVWSLVAENYDSGVDIQVDHYLAAASQVAVGTPVHVRLTRSAISGAIYYWGLERPSGRGFFERIQPGSGEHERLLPNPPGTDCVGCHTVSRDGRYLAGMLGGGSGSEPGAVFDLTADLSAAPAPTVFPTLPRNERFWFSSTFSPDSSRLFITSSYAILIDATNGTTRPATGLPPRDASNYFYSADWSPNGASIAMSHIDAATSSWGHKFSHGDLVVLPVTGPDAFGPLETLHLGDDLASSPEGGRVDTHPSWSPDSQYVAMQHGNWSRTTQGTGDTFADGFANGAIYLLSRDGTVVQRLDNAVGGAHGHRDYWPTFSPFVSREPDGTVFLWLAFTSGRDYGNAQVGTAAAPDVLGRQIWVTALEMPGGEFPELIASDPSHVPYWLPGQATDLENLGAYWSALACRRPDAECTISSECCSGYCAADATGALTCQTPPADRCRDEADSCGASGDCCRGLICQGNACVSEGPI